MKAAAELGNLKRTADSRSMELLAPAGSFPAFEAALEQGADGVYVGVPGLNARALSRDFTLAEIDSMIRQAHRLGVKLYLAMNSLVKEDELPRAIEALACFAELRPDALIIQDLGLLYLARTWFPDLVLHASTLMSVHNSMAAQELTHLGFERVVLARELTLAEMAEIHQKSDAELEVFVHGAMCFSYSGLCMFSSLHGGRSSLRGQCVQPCRRHYSRLQPGGRRAAQSKGADYLFSMNDLCGVDVLPELRAAGVGCLKIEGRMKSASYVANTVAAYRMALDSIDASDMEQERVLREAHRLLDDAMARTRSTGYLLSEQPREAITPEQSGSSGTLLGRVKGVQQERGRDGRFRTTLQFILAAPLSEGDRLRLHDERSGERTGFTLHSLQVKGQRRKRAAVGERVRIELTTELQGGHHFQGSVYKVDVRSRITAERTGHKRSKKLIGRRIIADKKKVEQILDHLSWKAAPSVSRHSTGARMKKKKGPARQKGSRRSSRRELPQWVVLASIADINGRLPVRAARIVVVLNRENSDRLQQLSVKLKKKRGRIIWRLPPVIQEKELDWYEEQINRLVDAGFNRFELGHCSQYGLFLSQFARGKRPELYGQYTLNLLNSAALHGVSHLGFHGVLFSLESEENNLVEALSHFRRQVSRARSQVPHRLQLGMYVYGRPPLFTARLDGKHFHYQEQIVSPREELYTLEHRDGLTLARAVLPFSLLRWQQELVAAGVDYLVFDLSGGPLRREAAIVSGLLGGSKKRQSVMSGNYKGTLV